MISLVLVVMLRTFSIMRIFDALTPLVIMLTNVLWDLRVFLFFFAIIIFKFSLVMCVLGIGNVNIPGKFRDDFKDYDFKQPFDECGGTMPGIEYHTIGLFFGNIVQVLRLSIGDFAVIDLITYLDVAGLAIFWLIWALAVLIQSVIFLNIIVAEASSSYAKVTESLVQVIQQEKAALITESDVIKVDKYKDERQFPKYITTR
jgi:hypothetical protein